MTRWNININQESKKGENEKNNVCLLSTECDLSTVDVNVRVSVRLVYDAEGVITS
jgi:hypothetical protein